MISGKFSSMMASRAELFSVIRKKPIEVKIL
jgi:hypothetical protein